MKPVVIIPTYWDQSQTGTLVPGRYDHAANTSDTTPDLEKCLSSFEQVQGLLRIVVLAVCPHSQTDVVRARVYEIAEKHPDLPITIVTNKEASVIADKIETITPNISGEVVSLRGYGAIRNMGLVVASILGYDSVVFVDDDEVITVPNFLDRAMYGLGYETRQGLPILAKTGFFYDRNDSPLADTSKRARKCDQWWTKREEFNQWMRRALTTTRISRSNYACGGCMAIHARAFMRIAFDPFITRGEDLDYLFNLRMHGYDMWFDNQWNLRHYPPARHDSAPRFMQDVYRWYYERAKIREANSRIELHQITASSLMPYPGPWISKELDQRVAKTSFLRMIATSEHINYFKIWVKGRFDAEEYGRRNARKYLQFQNFWPHLMNALWCDDELGSLLDKSCTTALSLDEHNR